MPRRETESKVKYKSASDLPPAMMARDITWSEAWPEVEINTGPGQVSNRPLSLSVPRWRIQIRICFTLSSFLSIVLFLFIFSPIVVLCVIRDKFLPCLILYPCIVIYHHLSRSKSAPATALIG